MDPAALTPAEAASVIVDEAVADLGRIRQMWPWLGVMRSPGRAAPAVERPDQPWIEAHADEQAALDKQAKFDALQAGRKPSGPRPDAARAIAIDARTRISGTLARLAGRLTEAYEHVADRTISWGTPLESFTGSYRTQHVCRDCSGTGIVPRPKWMPAHMAWPALVPLMVPSRDDPTIMIKDPDGRLVQPPLPECTACRLPTDEHGEPAPGPRVVDTWHTYDQADALMSVALDVVADLLWQVDDVDRATDAARQLRTCVRLAEKVCGIAQDQRKLKAPCPACQVRSLYAEVSSINRREWTVRCGNETCQCSGPDCKCGRPVRWSGRRHLWPAREWDGPKGLAKRLGVDLPGTQRAEGKTAHRGVPETASPS